MSNKFKAIRKTVSSKSVEYFTKLGGIIKDHRNKGIPIPKELVDENWDVANMRDIIYITNDLGGELEYSDAIIIARDLFNKERMYYRDFAEEIYKILCTEIEGGMEYVPYHLSSNKTFNDLYLYIQNIRTNEFGYVVINEKYAVQIYPAKVQFNICVKDDYDKWHAVLNFIFDIRADNIIARTIYADDNSVDDGGQEIALDMLVRDFYLISAMPSGFEIQNILLSIL